jgi:hypothetical protein
MLAGSCWGLTPWARRISGIAGGCLPICPTLTMDGNYNRKEASKKSGDGLWTHLVKLTTITKSCGKVQGKYGNGQPTLTSLVGGPLNPMWAAWFMGWPMGATRLKRWAMGGSRSRRRSHGDSSADR